MDGEFLKENTLLRPTHVRWIVFALASTTSWMLYLHRYTFALIKPALVEEWGITKSELGLLDSAFFSFYTFCQVPLGALSDIVGVHLVLTGMILIWSFGFALHAMAGSTSVLWWARSIFGLGQSAVFATVSRITRTWFAPTHRATIQGLAGVFSGRFGGLSGYVLFGFLLVGVVGLDWRTAVYLLAGAGVLLAVLFAACFRNSPADHPLTNDAEVALIQTGDAPPTGPVPGTGGNLQVRQLLRRMSPRSILNLFALNLQSILSAVADNIYSNWIPLFLFEVHALKFKEMGIYSALPLLGGALGGAIGGWLNDICIRRTGNRRWSRTVVALTGKGLAAVCLFTALLRSYDNPYEFCVMLFLVKLFGDWSLTTAWATVTDIGGRATASVYAFNNSVAGIGAIIAPAVYGYVSQEYGWKTVFVIAGAAYVLCSLSWLLVNCTIPILKSETIPEDPS